jgi:hypothetical protein
MIGSEATTIRRWGRRGAPPASEGLSEPEAEWGFEARREPLLAPRRR